MSDEADEALAAGLKAYRVWRDEEKAVAALAPTKKKRVLGTARGTTV